MHGARLFMAVRSGAWQGEGRTRRAGPAFAPPPAAPHHPAMAGPAQLWPHPSHAGAEDAWSFLFGPLRGRLVAAAEGKGICASLDPLPLPPVFWKRPPVRARRERRIYASLDPPVRADLDERPGGGLHELSGSAFSSWMESFPLRWQKAMLPPLMAGSRIDLRTPGDESGPGLAGAGPAPSCNRKVLSGAFPWCQLSRGTCRGRGRGVLWWSQGRRGHEQGIRGRRLRFR